VHAVDITTVVLQLYAALGSGDEEALLALLDPAFVAAFAEGMPAGAGRAEGAAAARDHWWAIGAEYAVRPVVDELVPCVDGRLLARGRYRGERRSDGRALDAAFTHLWTASDGRLTELHQVTDTALW
jgi:ketosteroid isomerase-like protein